MKTQNALLNEPVAKTLLLKTLPMAWGIFAVIGFNVIDTYFVGMIGKKELAAISFTFPVVMVFRTLSLGLSAATSSVISRALGEGDFPKVQRLATHSILLSLCIVLLFILLGVFSINPLFRALGAEDEILQLVRQYMLPWYLGMSFVVIPMVGNGAIRATGDMTTPSIIMTIAGGVNLILDPIFIFGFLFIPAMGIQGAAFATILSNAFTLIAALYYLRKLKMLAFQNIELKRFKESSKELLRIGIPAGVTNLITPLSIGIVTALVARYGEDAVAGFGVASRIESLGIIPILALSATIGPFVGQNWGAKQTDRMKKAIFFSFRASIAWSLYLALAFFFFGDFLMSLFTQDPKVIQIGEDYLKLICFSLGFQGILFQTNASFNALGRPLLSTMLSSFRMFVFYIPVSLTLMYFYGLEGIFWGAVVSNLSAGCISYLLVKKLYCS